MRCATEVFSDCTVIGISAEAYPAFEIFTATSQLPASAGAGKTLSIFRSGNPLSASTQSAKNHERLRRVLDCSRSLSNVPEPWSCKYPLLASSAGLYARRAAERGASPTKSLSIQKT